MLCSRGIFVYLFLPYFYLSEEKKKKRKKTFQAETAFPRKGRSVGDSRISSEDSVDVVDFVQKTFKNHSNEAA